MTCTETSSPTRRAAAGAGIGGGFDSADVTADSDDDVAGADEFLAGKDDIGGLDHGVGGFNSAGQSLRFDQAKGLIDILASSGMKV